MATCTITHTEPSGSGIELQPFPQPEVNQKEILFERTVGISDPEDFRDEPTPPDTAVEVLQKWNCPRSNLYRVLSCFWSFFTFGMNDGSYGALIPYLETYYSLSYTIVSLIFLSPFIGYTTSSLVNNHIHVTLGQRGVAILGPISRLTAYIVLSLHPPYPVLIVVFILVGFGNGLASAAWASWIGNMVHANQVSGVLQGCYSLGAVVSPLIATGLVHNGGRQWYSFYYLMISATTFELLTSSYAFWPQTGPIYVRENPRDPNSKTGRTREALKNKLTWIFAIFIFGYVGAEVSLGGWIITFMTRIRHTSPLTSASTSTGFWAGMTLGRFALSFLTARLGEFVAVVLYLGLAVLFELLFWLVPNGIVSTVSVALLGLFMGPVFPTAIICITRLLARELHVPCIGFASAFGSSGGAVFPFMVGAVAQARGVRSLQPIILSLLAAISGLWFLLPRKVEKGHGRGGERNPSEGVVGGR